ncbi:MAG: signal recognition particle-docking protein FtsY [Methylophilaceae bacterium]
MFNFLKKLIKKPSKTKTKSNIVANKRSKPSASKTKTPKKLVETKPKPKKTEIFSFAEKIKKGLSKTRAQLNTQLTELFSSYKIDEEFYNELEMILLTADVGISATTMLIEKTRESVKEKKIKKPAELKKLLMSHLIKLLKTIEEPLNVNHTPPFIIMVVGVNGTGKTTSIGKLTKLFQAKNKTVLIAAGDTYRAAAVEQLIVWGKRNNVQVITQKKGDPSAVIFDAVNSAKAKNIDVVIADTAGRLPTQKNLIDEITKIKKVITKCHATGPQEILLVLDANTGQNAITQLNVFNEALGVTGLIMTKLDGTAKGGIIAAIAKDIPTPLRYIGVGENIDDLRVFNAKDYVKAMFE